MHIDQFEYKLFAVTGKRLEACPLDAELNKMPVNMTFCVNQLKLTANECTHDYAAANGPIIS